jgi:hypothetical protein
MVQQWLDEEPNTTAKDLFIRLNTQIPNRFKPSQLRTLQRRVKEWRTAIARRLVLGCNDDPDAQTMLSGIQSEATNKDVVTL